VSRCLRFHKRLETETCTDRSRLRILKPSKSNLKKALPDLPTDYAISVEDEYADKSPDRNVPSLNIVIFVVGSRGDVQPYLSLALNLILSDSRHRVRICTHGVFKDFVLGTGKKVLKKRLEERKKSGSWTWKKSSSMSRSTSGMKSDVDQQVGDRWQWEDEKRWSKEQREGFAPAYTDSPGLSGGESDREEEAELMNNLEFFDIGGSPKDLMAYMVKSKLQVPRRGNGEDELILQLALLFTPILDRSWIVARTRIPDQR
jgi:hypothetical protein